MADSERLRAAGSTINGPPRVCVLVDGHKSRWIVQQYADSQDRTQLRGYVFRAIAIRHDRPSMRQCNIRTCLLANASYQIVIEGASYRERLSPHRALLDRKEVVDPQT